MIGLTTNREVKQILGRSISSSTCPNDAIAFFSSFQSAEARSERAHIFQDKYVYSLEHQDGTSNNFLPLNTVMSLVTLVLSPKESEKGGTLLHGAAEESMNEKLIETEEEQLKATQALVLFSGRCKSLPWLVGHFFWLDQESFFS